MTWQARVADEEVVGVEVVSDASGGGALFVEAYREGFEAAEEDGGVLGGEATAGGVDDVVEAGD